MTGLLDPPKSPWKKLLTLQYVTCKVCHRYVRLDWQRGYVLPFHFAQGNTINHYKKCKTFDRIYVKIGKKSTSRTS